MSRTRRDPLENEVEFKALTEASPNRSPGRVGGGWWVGEVMVYVVERGELRFVMLFGFLKICA